MSKLLTQIIRYKFLPLSVLSLLLLSKPADAAENIKLTSNSLNNSNPKIVQDEDTLTTNNFSISSKMALLVNFSEKMTVHQGTLPTFSTENTDKLFISNDSLSSSLQKTQLVALEPILQDSNSIPIPVLSSENQENIEENSVLSSDSTNYSPEANNKPVLIKSNIPDSNLKDSQSIPISITSSLNNSDSNIDSSPKTERVLSNFQPKIHQVKRGDTLSSIASKYGVTKEELIQANNLTNSNQILINQSLKIPSVTTEITDKPVLIAIEMPKSIGQNSDLKRSNQTEINQKNLHNHDHTNHDHSSQGNIASNIPLHVEHYQPGLQPSLGKMVSPELPQLYPSDQYLPDSNRPFKGYIWPAKGVLTSGYGWRWGRMHKGIDIAAPIGTPIFASADGKVISSGWSSGGYGNLIKLRHFDGSMTLYAHNSKNMVRRGQIVNQGQQIATMGSTGFSTGPHLHFEIHPKSYGRAVNPMAFLPKK